MGIEVGKNELEYINESELECCKYISNVYRCISSTSSKIVFEDNCEYNLSVEGVISICNKNNFILCIVDTSSDRRERLIDECKNKNIEYSVISLKDNYSTISLKEKEVFLDVNLDCINKWYNWDAELEEKYSKIIEKFGKVEYEELCNNTEEIINSCILNNNKIVYPEDENKFNILTLMKKIDKLHSKKISCNVYGANDANYITEFFEIVTMLNLKSNDKRLDFVYDLVCEKMERDIARYNYCLFESNNKCIAQRDNAKWPENKENGCCFEIGKKRECQYLSNKSCRIKCVSCRVFTCKYLKDRGVDFDVRRNILVRYNLNLLQRAEFVWNFFETKEQIIAYSKRFTLKKYNEK